MILVEIDFLFAFMLSILCNVEASKNSSPQSGHLVAGTLWMFKSVASSSIPLDKSVMSQDIDLVPTKALLDPHKAHVIFIFHFPDAGIRVSLSTPVFMVSLADEDETMVNSNGCLLPTTQEDGVCCLRLSWSALI